MSDGTQGQTFLFPMSFAQQRLWLLDQLEGGNPAYNVAAVVELGGILHEKALEESFRALVRRHETLRTTFGLQDGDPVQIIAEEVEFSMASHDLTHLPREHRPSRLAAVLRKGILRPFDLGKGPLLRVTLIRQSPELHTLLMVMHHIISDGWSMGVLSAELGTLYDAFSRGAANPLPELEIQYADFSSWQREWLEGEEQVRQLDYWREKLKGAPTHVDLATDHPRPATQSFSGGTVPVALDPGVVRGLETLCAETGTTLSMVLLAGFFVLLSRFGDSSDMVVGTPVANRRRREVESLIGCFVNTLPIRGDLSNDPGFRDLLVQLRETSLDAWANQDVPFEQLVEALQPERDLSRSPLFQVMFIFQNTPDERLALPGLDVRTLELDGETAKFDLTLSLHESPRGVEGVLEFNDALFDPGTVESMATAYGTLLADAAVDPERPVFLLRLLPPGRAPGFMDELNDTVVGVPETTVTELFESRASAFPDAIAVVGEDGRMTYGELNTRSNQLARHLRRHGVTTGVPVGVCLGRSCRTPLALLGVLKAGAAFVPMDPTFPRDRVAIMLEDSASSLVVCDPAAAEGTLAGLPVKAILLDDALTALAEESGERLEDGPTGEDLAYIIFTSGSTGRPKGVEVGHRSLAILLLAMADCPGLEAGDTLLAITTISFDIALLEFFLPLVQGAQLMVARREEARDPERLERILHQGGVTVMQATPATWQMLITSGWAGTPGLKILCGGEALPGDLAEALLTRGDAVWNMYGPTETTIWSAVHRVRPPIALHRPQPIGRPIPNTALFVLDARLQPVPPGAPGELCIGGLGLARGYVGQPELTEARFVPNPIDGDRSPRLYRTGDRVRVRADGSIEYLGRMDEQMKLRGFRIEPAEIESALRSHSGVSEAAVILREGPLGEGQLAAFAALGPKRTTGADELGSHLRRQLPDYMVPGQISVVEALPLTPNGKVDRKALREMAVRPSTVASERTPPLNPLQERIARVWQELLDRPVASIRENFFEVGGHSLLAVRMVALLRHRLGVDLSLATLFQHPTVEGLAEVLQGAPEARSGTSLVPLSGPTRSIPLFCVPGAGGDPGYLHGLAELVGKDRQLLAFRAPGLEEGTEKLTGVEALADHYLEAIRSTQPRGPYLLAGHSFGSRVTFEMAQRLLHGGEEVAALVVFDTVAPVIPNPTADWDQAHHLADLAAVVSRMTSDPIELSASELRALPQEHRMDALWRKLREGGHIPPGIGSDGLRRLMEVYTTNLGMDYVVEEARPVPVTLIKAEEQLPWEGPRPAALIHLLAEADWGWNRLATGPVDPITVPGDHLSMFRPPQVVEVARALLRVLSSVLPGV